jgi:membrane protease YdiL (CAAX protease family)
MTTEAIGKRSLARFVLFLFGLSLPIWILGAEYDVELFSGFKLFQLPLAMPGVAALILTFREQGRDGIVALLGRCLDFPKIGPKIWLLVIFLLYPCIGLFTVAMQRMLGIPIPSPHFSVIVLLGYSTVFFLTFGEELGLTGYAIDPLQERYSSLMSGILLGLIWAGYHIPGFIISGYYTYEWIVWHALYIVAGRVLFVWIYNNSGRSLFAMALLHSTFGVFWTLWPETGNLQKAPPEYDPRVAALVTVSFAAIVTSVWGYQTLANCRCVRNASRRA